MTAIPTATGTVDSAELGRVLVHEHVFVLGEEFRQNYADWDEDARVYDAEKQLDELRSLGIDTILDPTVLGLGRRLPRIQKIAAGTDLRIIVATGITPTTMRPSNFITPGRVCCSISQNQGSPALGVRGVFVCGSEQLVYMRNTVDTTVIPDQTKVCAMY